MTGETQPQESLWLVRKKNLQIFGPFSREQIVKMFEEGVLEVTDELCPENSYWFSSQEKLELKRWLGVDASIAVPASSRDEEITKTSETITTESELASVRSTPVVGVMAPLPQSNSVEVLRAKYQRPSSAILNQSPHLNKPALFERSQIWSAVVFFLSILGGAAALWILRLLKGH